MLGIKILTEEPAKKLTRSAFLLVLALIVPLYLWETWVVLQGWSWFVSPVWNIPTPPFAALLGIRLVFTFLKNGGSGTPRNEYKVFDAIGRALTGELFVFALMFVVHLYI